MRARAVGVVAGATAIVAAGAPAAARAQQAPPPPPLAFHSALLNRHAHTIDVKIQAVDDVGVVVRLNRHRVRIGRSEAMVHPGATMVHVRIGPKTMRKLRPGLHVIVRIFFGGPIPLRTDTKLLRAPDELEA